MAKKPEQDDGDTSGPIGTSDLDKHKRVKGGLSSPLNATIGNRLRLLDWFKDRAPEFLWWDALNTIYGLSDGGARGRKVLDIIREVVPDGESIVGRISDFLLVPIEEREKLAPAIRSVLGPEFSRFQSVIELYKECPMSWIWGGVEKSEADAETYLKTRLRALSGRRGKEATDAQFLAIAELIYTGKLYLSVDDNEVINMLLTYPNVENFDMAAAIIGSMSKAMSAEEGNSSWVETFWRENRERTQCFVRGYSDLEDYIEREIEIENATTLPGSRHGDASTLRSRLREINYAAVHKGVDVDWFDVVVGLASRAVRIVEDLARQPELRRGIWLHSGLRILCEAVINAHYILQKGPDAAKQFKEYGRGQAKMAHRKALKRYESFAEDIPKETKKGWERAIRGLHESSNLERIDDFVDIKWNDWSGVPLRRRATELGLEGIYDMFSYVSDDVHSTWNNLREQELTLCVNPTHGLHHLAARQLDRLAADPVTVPILFTTQLLDAMGEQWEIKLAQENDSEE